MILIAAAVLFVAALFFYSLHVGFKYTRMIGNIFLSLVYDPPDETSPPSHGEKIVILDSSDREIEALLVTAPAARWAVIFCHESGSSKESWEKYAYFLPRIGCSILSVDLNARENSESPNPLSQWPSEENVQRIVTAVRWAKKAFAGTPIVLFGVSNGADAALAASFSDREAVEGVIADGLFSMKEIFRDYIARWAPVLVRTNLFGKNYPRWVVSIFSELGFWYCQRQSGRRFVDVEKLLRRPHAPLLMIHGESDDYIPSGHQKFLRKIGSKSALRHLVIPSAGHNQSIVLARDAYEREITRFLEGLK